MAWITIVFPRYVYGTGKVEEWQDADVTFIGKDEEGNDVEIVEDKNFKRKLEKGEKLYISSGKLKKHEPE